MGEQAAETDRLVARAGDTFPCGIEEPHHSHLFPVGPINVYRCSGDTDTRGDRSGQRVQTGCPCDPNECRAVLSGLPDECYAKSGRKACIGCTSPATALVQDGPNRKPICDTHGRIYGERGYQTYPPETITGAPDA